MRLNIAPKLFIGFLVIIFTNVFFFVIITKLDDLNSIANILKRQNEIKNDLARIKTQHNVQGLMAYSYEKVGKLESVDNFRQVNKDIIGLIDTFSVRADSIYLLDSLITQKNNFDRVSSKPLVSLMDVSHNLRTYNAVYNNMFDSLVQTQSVNPSDKRAEVLKTVLGDIDKKLTVEIEGAQSSIIGQTDAHIREIQDRVSNVKQVTMTILAAMAAFSIIFALFFSRAITNSMRRLKESASTIGKGNFDFNVSGYPHDEIGELATAFHDMANDLKNAQEELVKSKRLAAIGEIVASVNHEINNPLMIISGNAQFLEMSMEGYPDEMKERVRAILDETERISLVTRKLREIRNPVIENYTASGEQMINLEKSTL
jgi:nitrogen fixation/metabolism regulation signal transduction histidine kinase